MLEHNDLTLDEQADPGLTQQLKDSYLISQADQQSLQRIRERLRQTRMAASTPIIKRENTNAGQFVLPPVQQPSHAWRWRISALAVLLLISLLGGTFLVSKTTDLAHTGKKPVEEKPTTTPIIPLKNQPTILQINMKSTTTGWGEAHPNDGRAQTRLLVHTTDSGQSWKEIQLPAPYTTFIRTFFLDATTAWVIPGTGLDPAGTPLIRTLDGGKSWEQFTLPGATSEITFIDKMNGWATDVFQKGQDATQPVQELSVFHTTNGGKTWDLISKAQAGTTNTSPGPFPVGEFGTATFLNSQVGWFVRGSYNIAIHSDTNPALYITQDGGVSWQEQVLPQSDEILYPASSDSGTTAVSISQPKFFDAQHGSLFIQRRDDKGLQAYLYNTENGGQSWQLVGDKISVDNISSLSSPGAEPAIITLIDSTHFMITQKGEADVYTLVGGQWQPQHKAALKGVIYNNSNFVDGKTGWLIANGPTINDKKTNYNTTAYFVYMTNDGGKTWKKIQESSNLVKDNTSGG